MVPFEFVKNDVACAGTFTTPNVLVEAVGTAATLFVTVAFVPPTVKPVILMSLVFAFPFQVDFSVLVTCTVVSAVCAVGII